MSEKRSFCKCGNMQESIGSIYCYNCGGVIDYLIKNEGENMDVELKYLDLREAQDDVIRAKVNINRAKCGCGSRFEYGDYINGEICTDEHLCYDCERTVEMFQSELSDKETKVLGIKIAKNSDILNQIKQILLSGLNHDEQIKKIQQLIH